VRDFTEAVKLEEVETVWMSPACATEFGLSLAERAAMNRYLVDGWRAMHAPNGRCSN